MPYQKIWYKAQHCRKCLFSGICDNCHVLKCCISCEVLEISRPVGYHTLSSYQSLYAPHPLSTKYCVALKLKNGSNSLSSYPYSNGYDRTIADMETAMMRTATTSRWCRRISNDPILKSCLLLSNYHDLIYLVFNGLEENRCALMSMSINIKIYVYK